MKSVVTLLALLLSPISIYAQDVEVTSPQVVQPEAVAPPVVLAPVPIAPNVVVPVTTYIVRQIIKSYHLVVIEMQGTQVSWLAGKIFLVNLDDSKQCTLVVKEISASYITLDSSTCESESSISTKSSVEPALVGVTASTPPVENPEKVRAQIESAREASARFGLSLYYSMADEVEFNSAYISTNSGSGNISAKFKTDGALGLGLSLTRMNVHSFGFSLGAALELKREIKEVTYSGPGGTYTGVGTGTLPKLSIFYVEYQGIYRWNHVYLPFGINISGPYVTDYSGMNIDVKSGFGFVLGVGFIVGENTSVEILARSIGLYLKESDSSGYIDYRYGTLAGTNVGFKYRF